MMKNINPPIITIHAPITMAQIIISFFKAFLFSIFSLFVLQNCIIAVISHSNATIGRPKIKNSIYSLHFPVLLCWRPPSVERTRSVCSTVLKVLPTILVPAKISQNVFCDKSLPQADFMVI